MEDILNIIDRLRQLSGNAQIDELSKHKDNILLREILTYTYDPNFKFKVNEGKFNKVYADWIRNKVVLDESTSDIMWYQFKEGYLIPFSSKKAIKEIDLTLMFDTIWLQTDDRVLELFKCVLFKDLRLGFNISTINKAFGQDVIQGNSVQLAETYRGELPKYGSLSRKLDGKRGYYLNGVFYSRTNKPCKTAPIVHITKRMETLDQGYVYDGEFVFIDNNGNEDFQKAISLTSSDERTPECDNLHFAIFSMIPKENFIAKNPTSYGAIDEYGILCNQLAEENSIVNNGLLSTKYHNLFIVNQYPISAIDYLSDMAKKNNWEGLMLRFNEPYQFKRTKYLQKIKAMQDSEFKIVNFKQGGARTKYKDTLGALTVQLNTGELVDVGSGYSDEQRGLIWAKKEIILERGLYAKVKYFEVTKDKKGNNSLRFPVFISLRDNNLEDIDLNSL